MAASLSMRKRSRSANSEIVEDGDQDRSHYTKFVLALPSVLPLP